MPYALAHLHAIAHHGAISRSWRLRGIVGGCQRGYRRSSRGDEGDVLEIDEERVEAKLRKDEEHLPSTGGIQGTSMADPFAMDAVAEGRRGAREVECDEREDDSR